MNNNYQQQYQQRPPPPRQGYQDPYQSDPRSQQPPPPRQGYQEPYRPDPRAQQPPPPRSGYDQRPPPQRPPAQRPPQRPQQRQQQEPPQQRQWQQPQPPLPPPPQQQKQQPYYPPARQQGRYYEQRPYEYDDGRGPYDNGNYYQEEYTYEQRNDMWQGQEQEPDQSREYRYDDRYRSNGERPVGQQQHYQPEHRAPMPQREHGRPSTGASQPSRDRPRILQAEPTSPQGVAWDNPFGAFPSKKSRGSDLRDKNQDVERASSGTISDNKPGSRPSTSHANTARPAPTHNQNPEFPRVSDSGPQQTRHSDVASPRDAARPLPNDRSWQDFEPRQHPQRTMTEPAIGYGYDNGDRPAQYHDQHHSSMRQPTYDNHVEPRMAGQAHQHSNSREVNPVQPHDQHHPPIRQQTYDSYVEPGMTGQDHRSSESRRANPVQPLDGVNSYNAMGIPGGTHGPTSPQYPDDMQRTGTFDQPQMADTMPVPTAVEIPNFDNMIQNRDENHLDPIFPAKPVSAYQKPTYQNTAADRQLVQSPSQGPEALASALHEFSFDLPSSNQATSPHPITQASAEPEYGLRDPPPAPFTPYEAHGPPQPHYPPRSASRGNMRPPPREQYEQPPMPQFAAPARQPSYDQYNAPPDFGRGGQQPRDRYDGEPRQYPDPPSQHPTPLRDMSRTGYDPRLQSGAGGVAGPPQQLQAPLQRPLTSNSIQFPINGGVRRISSDSYQQSIRSQPDLSSRPVPFRPGLLQTSSQPSPAPSPAPYPAQSSGSEAAAARPAKAKVPEVTTQELNTLRQTYQADPDNHELGLRFAKRLVEAAKVLPSETARTDPKQAAKNRERYILDAHKIVKKLIHAGYTDAMFYMADCYGQGLLGLQSDPKEAFSLYQSAAKLGHAQAAYRVAVCCELGPEEGGGTRRDPVKACQWYKRAASLGDPPAMYKMGMIQLKGLLGQPRNPREAITWLKRGAERASEENPHAVHELALLYESAQPQDVVVRDDKYAVELFTQAAELGYKYSQFRLGSIYEYGLLGCPIDPRLSIAWYSRAAAQGEHQAEFALSGWYLTGGAPPAPGQPPLLDQSDTEAYLWARKAAASGLAKAEYAMGYYTEVGIGVTPNVEEAKKWYFRATAQNHPKARERLEDLRKGGARMQKTRVSRSNVGKQNEGECVVM